MAPSPAAGHDAAAALDSARAWVAAARRGDADAMWRLTHRGYREALVRRHATLSVTAPARELRELAAVAASSPPARQVRERVLAVARERLAGSDGWRWSSDAGPVGADDELVTLVGPWARGPCFGAVRPCVALLMRRDSAGAWRVVRFGEDW